MATLYLCLLQICNESRWIVSAYEVVVMLPIYTLCVCIYIISYYMGLHLCSFLLTQSVRCLHLQQASLSGHGHHAIPPQKHPKNSSLQVNHMLILHLITITMSTSLGLHLPSVPCGPVITVSLMSTTLFPPLARSASLFPPAVMIQGMKQALRSSIMTCIMNSEKEERLQQCVNWWTEHVEGKQIW